MTKRYRVTVACGASRWRLDSKWSSRRKAEARARAVYDAAGCTARVDHGGELVLLVFAQGRPSPSPRRLRAL
jgi:hypothetical protein